MSFNHYCNTNIKTLQTLMVVGGGGKTLIRPCSQGLREYKN